MRLTNIFTLLLINTVLSGCSLLTFLTESKMQRAEKKIRIVLDHPESEKVLHQLENQFVQVYSQEGLEGEEVLAQARKEVRHEVDWLMTISLRNPEVAGNDKWVKNRSTTLQKKFTKASKSLCDACATSSSRLLTIMCESLFHPLPKINPKRVRKSIDKALKKPAAKQLLAKAQKVREQIYIACNPDMEVEVAKHFALLDVYEKLGFVSAEYETVLNPKYTLRFYNDTRIHLQNLRNAFPGAPYQLCEVYVDCWSQLQAIMTEAHGGFYAQR